MRLLILGGTRFVGRHIVAEALDRGHDVTTFNRGRTNPDLFPAVRRLIGDRDCGDLGALGNSRWDAVIDVSGRRPEQVRATADLLREVSARYCFVSSVAVYASVDPVVSSEDSAPILAIPATGPTPAHLRYGVAKAACERIIGSTYGSRAVILRPGIVVGPHDPTNRFSHWVARTSREGPVLGPPRPHQPVQMIHAGDLAAFVLRLLEHGDCGALNCVGPPTTFAEMLMSCRAASSCDGDTVWAPEDLLTGRGISLPFTLPQSGRRDGAFLRPNDRATAAGLQNRPIAQSARSVLGWMAADASDRFGDSALPSGEAALLSELLAAQRRKFIGGGAG